MLDEEGVEKKKSGGNTEESKNIVWSAGIRIYTRGGEGRVSGIAKKYRRSTEKIRILAVTTGGMDETGDRERAGCWESERKKSWGGGAKRRKERERERERERKGTLSWFPSGDFIMASSYYRRTSGHERDTILRQGTEADLTSGQIYGRTSGLSILSRKADRPNRTERPIQRPPDNDNDDREMIKRGSMAAASFRRDFDLAGLFLFLDLFYLF